MFWNQTFNCQVMVPEFGISVRPSIFDASFVLIARVRPVRPPGRFASASVWIMFKSMTIPLDSADDSIRLVGRTFKRAARGNRRRHSGKGVHYSYPVQACSFESSDRDCGALGDRIRRLRWVLRQPGPHRSLTRTIAQTVTNNGKSHQFDSEAACAEVIKAHNRLRAEAKLAPLEVSKRLQGAALKHAKDMAAHGKMTHKGSDGSTSMKRILAKGYNYRRAGENVAAGYFTVEGLMKGWMDSPHHKRNILGSFSQIGVACATGENGKRYWCVTFGLPARQ